MKPIYEPRGKAKEYGDYALNIYTGCPHRCYYCFAPNVLHREREQFHSVVEPRKGIIDATHAQLEKEQITGKLIHLCFTCDPYPTGFDTTPTREIIKLLKQYGNHVQILTKGDGKRDVDLLDDNDWYGVTITGIDDGPYSEYNRLTDLTHVKMRGVKTWVSFEPVRSEEMVFNTLVHFHDAFDKVKIGKLNYYPSDINWGRFGRAVEHVCQTIGVDYYIKDSLRAEMEKAT